MCVHSRWFEIFSDTRENCSSFFFTPTQLSMPVDQQRLLQFAREASAAMTESDGRDIASSPRPPHHEFTLDVASSLPVLARILHFVFPTLKCYASLQESMSSWATLQTLCNTILGIPSSCLDVTGDDKLSILATLYFFHSVSCDHTFCEEFAVPLSHDLILFVQSEDCIAVLLRGGAVPVVAPSTPSSQRGREDQHHQQQRQQLKSTRRVTRATTSRQLDWDEAAVYDGTPALKPAEKNPLRQEQESFSESAEEDPAAREEGQEAMLSGLQLEADKVRTSLRCFSDMVDAALGSPELSASSKHRDALAAGLRAVDQLVEKTSALMHHHQQHPQTNRKHTSSSVSAELKKMMVATIQERDRLAAEVAAFRDMIPHQHQQHQQQPLRERLL